MTEAATVHPAGTGTGARTKELSRTNVARPERWASMLGGAALTAYGLTRRSLSGTALALAGGSLIYRGATGHCPAYGAMGVSTADGTRQGLRLEKSFTVDRPAAELYDFWRRFENLPRFMPYVETVDVTDGRSHWAAKPPTGQTVEWDAEITDDRQNERIAWRSLPGSDFPNEGAVSFRPAPNGRGTVVTLAMEVQPPGGAAGAAIAQLFGAVPEQWVTETLRRFKEFMEAGEIPTIQGQPHG